MNQSQLARFRAADWASIKTELVKYAERTANAKKWRSGSFLPKGHEAPDLVSLAITKTLNGIVGEDDGSGIRRWNEAVNPELIDHLKGAIDSEISNLVNSEEHTKTNYSPYLTMEEAQEIFEHAVDQTVEQAPSERAVEHEHFEKFTQKLYAELKDDEDAMIVLMAFEELAQTEDIVKAQAAANKGGLQIDAVRNAVRRIKRAADKIKLKMEKEVSDG